MSVMPTGRDVVKEALTVIAGAVLAALIIQQFPGVKAWIKQAWD